MVEEFPCIYVWVGGEHPQGFVVESPVKSEQVEEVRLKVGPEGGGVEERETELDHEQSEGFGEDVGK
jgi:hypothetical protein